MKKYYITRKADHYSEWQKEDPVIYEGTFYDYLLEEYQNVFPNYTVREELGDWYYILDGSNEETGEVYHVYEEEKVDAE